MAFALVLQRLVIGLIISRHFLTKSIVKPEPILPAFPRFVSGTCICFEFWLILWITCVAVIGQSDSFFWFHDTLLKTAV